METLGWIYTRESRLEWTHRRPRLIECDSVFEGVVAVEGVREVGRGHRRIDSLCLMGLGNVLIQVRQRGCCGVRSGRRHPQRESSVLVAVVVFHLDSA